MVDCARSLSPLGGLVVADAALRAGADRSAALAILDAGPGRRGVARARAVVELADEGAESPGETVTRYVLLREGLPRPQTQIPVVTRLGTFWADLGWEEWKVFLEYDGRIKYVDTEAWVREKRRHDAVVETGAHMLRVTKEDIPQRAGLATRALRLLPAGIARVNRPLLRA
jgi:very-short-patch-repair endonuclease